VPVLPRLLSLRQPPQDHQFEAFGVFVMIDSDGKGKYLLDLGAYMAIFPALPTG
jgi:hypothetical protein